jgi:hypothetical protein
MTVPPAHAPTALPRLHRPMLTAEPDWVPAAGALSVTSFWIGPTVAKLDADIRNMQMTEAIGLLAAKWKANKRPAQQGA